MVAGERGEGAPGGKVCEGGYGVREGSHNVVDAEVPVCIRFEDEGGGDVVGEDSNCNF